MDKVKGNEFFRNALAVFIVTAFTSSLPLLIWKTIPEANEQIITYIIGQISGMATTVLSAYFVNSTTANALDTKRADNTAKALDAVTAAIAATPTSTEPQPVKVEQPPNEPIPTRDV